MLLIASAFKASATTNALQFSQASMNLLNNYRRSWVTLQLSRYEFKNASNAEQALDSVRTSNTFCALGRISLAGPTVRLIFPSSWRKLSRCHHWIFQFSRRLEFLRISKQYTCKLQFWQPIFLDLILNLFSLESRWDLQMLIFHIWILFIC